MIVSSSGWIPSPPDARDHLYEPPEGFAATPAGVLSAEEHILSILSQGGRPTCVNHAVAQQVRAERHLAGDPAPELTSRAFGHYVSRATHTDPSLPGGTWFRAAYKAAAKVGLPPESAYPYVIGAERKMPDSDAFRQGYDARLEFEFKRIPLVGEALTDAIDELLAREKTAVFGTRLTAYLSAANFSKGPAPAPKDGEQLGGGHGLLIAKRLADGTYLLVNSHGENSGLKGWWWVAREYIQHPASEDFWHLEERK